MDIRDRWFSVLWPHCGSLNLFLTSPTSEKDVPAGIGYKVINSQGAIWTFGNTDCSFLPLLSCSSDLAEVSSFTLINILTCTIWDHKSSSRSPAFYFVDIACSGAKMNGIMFKNLYSCLIVNSQVKVLFFCTSMSQLCSAVTQLEVFFFSK